METAKVGDRVNVEYQGTLSDGTVFDKSEQMEVILGEYKVLPAFEDAVVGMRKGETKTFTVSHEDAYGEYRQELVASIEKALLPDKVKAEVGVMLQIETEQGNKLDVVISEVTQDTVTIDGNHPLAGKDLTFKISLAEIVG